MNMLESLIIILPIVALFCVLIIAFVNICLLIRKYFPVKVNCWFCNKYTQVDYEYRNAFYCSSCQQYNGFKEDGDYNKVIPEQHDEMLNRFSCVKQRNGRASNGLCRLCNNNQELKIHQLAAFVPLLNEKSYDIEIAHFKKLLEKAYKLCPKCEQVLHQNLCEQNKVLIGQRILTIHKKFIELLDINKSSKLVTTQQRKVFFNFLLYFTLILISILLLIESIKTNNLAEQNPKHVLARYLHPIISIINKVLRRIYRIYTYSFDSMNNIQEVQEGYNYLNSTFTLVKSIINNKLNVNVTHNQYLDYLIDNTPSIFLKRVQELSYEIALSTCGLFLQLCTFLLHKHNVYITVMWIFLLIIPYIDFDAYAIWIIRVLTVITVLYKTIRQRHLKAAFGSNNSPNGSSSYLTHSTASASTKFSNTSTSHLSASTNYFDVSNASKASFRDFGLPAMSARSGKNIRSSENLTKHFNGASKSIFGSKAVIENPLMKPCRDAESFIAESFKGSSKKTMGTVDPDDIQIGIMNLSLGKSNAANCKPRNQFVGNNVFLSPPSFVSNNYYNNRPMSWCTDNWLKRAEHPFNSRCSSQTSGFISLEPNDLNRSLPESASSSICDDLDRTSVVSEPICSPFQSRLRSSLFSTKSGLSRSRSIASNSNTLIYKNRFNNNKTNDIRLFKPIVFKSDERRSSDLY